MAEFYLTNEEFKSGFILEEYNGVYSLVNAYKPVDGDPKMKWGYIEKREKGPDDKWEGKPGKKLPWKIELGMREEAIERLTSVLKELEAEYEGPQPMDDGSVPF